MTSSRVQAALLSFGLVGVAKLASFGAKPLMDRLVPNAGDFGSFTVALAPVGLAAMVSVMGMQQALVRHIPSMQAQDNGAACRGAIVSAVLLALLNALGICVLMWLGRVTESVMIPQGVSDESFRWVLWAIPGQTLLVILPFAMLAQGHSTLFLVGSQLLFNVGLFLAVWWRSLRGQGDLETLLKLYVGSTWTAAAICLVLLVWTVHQQGWPLWGRIRLPSRDFFTYAITLLSASLSYVALGAVDKIMLDWFGVSGNALDNYAAAATLAATLPTVLVVLDAQVTPKLAAAWARSDRQAAADAYQSCNNFVLYLASPAVLGLIIFREPLMGLFGPQRVAGVPLLILMVAIEYLNVISGSSGRMLQLGGRPRVDALMATSAMLLNVFLNAAFIPQLGVYGAVLATLLTRLYLSGGKVLLVLSFWKILPWNSRQMLLNSSLTAITLLLLCYYADLTKLWPEW